MFNLVVYKAVHAEPSSNRVRALHGLCIYRQLRIRVPISGNKAGSLFVNNIFAHSNSCAKFAKIFNAK